MNPLKLKFDHYARLSRDDEAAIGRMLAQRLRTIPAREDIVREGERPQDVKIVMSGWGCRYKQLEDGRRQVIAFLLPGDICDLNVYFLSEADHSLASITPVTIAEISRKQIEDLSAESPRIAQALSWDALVSAAIQREWTLNLGRRTALERIAHLFCELFIRLKAVGLTIGNSCRFPIKQTDLADATGLSAVHVNRTLQELRLANLIALVGNRLTIPDLGRLQLAATFDGRYLHLGREGRHLDAND